ncbi:hypothetical protein [Lonepinella sp. BR2357]|uniref:hypothetical protein n=1 Tax=Lonepinella sp. BR2357 TaxID=3434549 RepID=UPI003F6E15CB
MITKERGYDEFLAKSIALGEADSQAGRVHSVEEVRKEIEAIYLRTYQGEESVGYRFNRNHTFADFKKAMLN